MAITTGRAQQTARKRIVQPALPLNFLQKKQAPSNPPPQPPTIDAEQLQTPAEEVGQPEDVTASQTAEGAGKSSSETQELSTNGLNTPAHEPEHSSLYPVSTEATPPETSFATAPDSPKTMTAHSTHPEVATNGKAEVHSNHEEQHALNYVSETLAQDPANGQGPEGVLETAQSQPEQVDTSLNPPQASVSGTGAHDAMNGTSDHADEAVLQDAPRRGVVELEASQTTKSSGLQTPDGSANGLEITKSRIVNGTYSFFSAYDRDTGNTVPSASDSGVDLPSPVVPFPPIQAHIATLGATKEWCDWQIQVYQPGNVARPFVAFVHGMVLCRSNPMRRFMERPREMQIVQNVIPLYPPRVVLDHAFEAALRFLYTDSVLTAESMGLSAGMHVTPHARPQLLDYVMSYWISGIELGLRPVANKGQELFNRVLSWEVIELAVKDAMTLGMLTGGPREQEYLLASNKIYELVFSFIAANIDLRRFELDVTSTSTLIPSLLSQLDDRPKNHNPALAGMVFGSMPTSPANPHSPITSSINTAVSNIMLNISFNLLSSLTERLKRSCGMETLAVISQALAERERRRLKVVSDRRISNKQRMSNSAVWEVAGNREFIDDEGNLKRESIGFLLPK